MDLESLPHPNVEISIFIQKISLTKYEYSWLSKYKQTH